MKNKGTFQDKIRAECTQITVDIILAKCKEIRPVAKPNSDMFIWSIADESPSLCAWIWEFCLLPHACMLTPLNWKLISKAFYLLYLNVWAAGLLCQGLDATRHAGGIMPCMLLAPSDPHGWLPLLLLCNWEVLPDFLAAASESLSSCLFFFWCRIF